MSRCFRQTSRCISYVCEDERAMANAWFAKKWNVGFFYWDQFSDDVCIEAAEKKIWLDWFNTDESLQWVGLDDEGKRVYHSYTAAGNVAKLCAQSVAEAMSDFTGPEVRILGHSLGAGLAARCSEYLHLDEHEARPTRMVLLDPVFPRRHALETVIDSEDNVILSPPSCPEIKVPPGVLWESDFGTATMQATARIVKSLWQRGVPTEVYLSSDFSENPSMNTPIQPLEQLVTIVRYQPEFCSHSIPQQQECLHGAVVPLYFLANSDHPPTLAVEEDIRVLEAGNCKMPSAWCSDKEMVAILLAQRKMSASGHQQRWVQTDGRGTIRTEDDIFKHQVEKLDLLTAPHYMLAPSEHTIAAREGWSKRLLVFVALLCMLIFLVIIGFTCRACAALDIGEEHESAASEELKYIGGDDVEQKRQGAILQTAQSPYSQCGAPLIQASSPSRSFIVASRDLSRPVRTNYRPMVHTATYSQRHV